MNSFNRLLYTYIFIPNREKKYNYNRKRQKFCILKKIRTFVMQK